MVFRKVLICIVGLAALSSPVANALEVSEYTVRVLQSLSLTDNLVAPPSASNRVAENKAAVQFGKALFFDPRLSKDGTISCATCHKPELHFTDGLARSQGLGRAMRNSPTIVGAAHNSWFYWDGRRDSLWAQALLPFEAPDELGATRVSVIRTILSDKSLQEMYLGIFGEPAIIQLLDDLPQSAGPFGTPAEKSAWTSLTHKTKSEVNIVFANIGKSIAAYERTITPQPGRFDKFVNSLVRADFSTAKKVLSENEMAGALLFVNSTKTNCLRCHNGPLLTNGGFHNIGTGKFTGSDMDFGRVFGVRVTLLDEFNCVGPYSDADPDDCSELRFLNIDEHVPLDGAFKVPTLRGLVRTAPYFHDGRHESIEDVLEHYRSPPDSGGANPHELNPLNLTELELEQLAAFLKTL